MTTPSQNSAAPIRFLLVGALAESLVNFRGPLLRVLRGAGYDVHAAAAAMEENEAVLASLASMGVTPHSVQIERAGLSPIDDLKTLWALIRLMRRIRPDIVLCYTIKPVIWGLIAAALTGARRRCAMITGLGYAFTDEDSGKRRVVHWVVRRLYRIALARSHLVFFQNPDDAALFRNLGLVRPGTRIVVVNGSGVDLNHFTPQPLPGGEPSFLLIARLLGHKGIREYASAAALVRQRFPCARFHLVGGFDPNPSAICKLELTRWRADGTLVWHGEHSDVRPFLAACHVYVLPSYREGTPRTVLEAMATGRPIITTDVPGCRETVVEGDNGFLITPRSTEALAEAMFMFLEDRMLIKAMGDRSLHFAREKYAADKVVAHMFAELELISAST